MHRLDDEQTAREAAIALQAEDRKRPAIVVSIAAGRAEPFVDVDELEQAVQGLCDVYLLPTGPASWAFTNELPDGRQVYGGASRVYSTDLAWIEDQYRSPLRFAYGLEDRKRVTDLLIGDALDAAHSSAPTGSVASEQSLPASGEVIGVIGGRALVRLDSGGSGLPAVVHPELVTAGVAAENMFTAGQQVGGRWDPHSNRLDVARSVQRPEVAFAGVSVGDALLARASDVTRDQVHLAVYPGLEIVVPVGELTDSATADARRLVTKGEVLPVWVLATSHGIPSQVAVLEPDDAADALPVSILQGGPPWLTATPPLDEDAHPVAEEAPAETLGAPGEAGGEGIAADLLAENQGLRGRIAELERQLDRTERERASARTDLRAAKQQLKKAAKESDGARSLRARTGSNLFADPVDQFKHEVYVSWAERTTPDDKEAYPKAQLHIGSGFLTTLDAVEGVDRGKVVDVVTEIITGRADNMPGRDMHQLRTGAGANDPTVTRADGATCWRVALQKGTPSARRLHFWRLVDGSIELSTVRLHDDMTP